MAEKKLLTQDDIHEMIRPIAEEIIEDARTVMKTAINKFYTDYSPFEYERAGSEPYFGFAKFIDFQFDDISKEIENGYKITFKFQASDVSINPFRNMQGSTDWAFDSGFVHGYHGGPKYGPTHTMGGVWKIFEDYINNET